MFKHITLGLTTTVRFCYSMLRRSDHLREIWLSGRLPISFNTWVTQILGSRDFRWQMLNLNLCFIIQSHCYFWLLVSLTRSREYYFTVSVDAVDGMCIHRGLVELLIRGSVSRKYLWILDKWFFLSGRVRRKEKSWWTRSSLAMPWRARTYRQLWQRGSRTKEIWTLGSEGGRFNGLERGPRFFFLFIFYPLRPSFSSTASPFREPVAARTRLLASSLRRRFFFFFPAARPLAANRESRLRGDRGHHASLTLTSTWGNVTGAPLFFHVGRVNAEQQSCDGPWCGVRHEISPG